MGYGRQIGWHVDIAYAARVLDIDTQQFGVTTAKQSCCALCVVQGKQGLAQAAGKPDGMTGLPVKERPGHGGAFEQGLMNGLCSVQMDEGHVGQHQEDIPVRLGSQHAALQRRAHA